MTRRISQSNISAYFGQPADTDFEVKRHTHTLPLPHELTRYSPCMIAVCLDGSARLAFSTAVHTFAKGEILCIVPGSYVCIESVTEDFSVCYGVIKESFMYDITSRFPNAMSDYLKQHPNIPMTPEAIDEAIRYFDLMELKMAEKFNLFQKDRIFNILYSYMLDMYNLINKKLPYVELPLGKTTVENMFDRFSSMAARQASTPLSTAQSSQPREREARNSGDGARPPSTMTSGADSPRAPPSIVISGNSNKSKSLAAIPKSS